MHLKGTILRCQSKIDKNEKYLADIRDLEETLETISRIKSHHGATTVTPPVQEAELDGEILIHQHLDNLHQMVVRETRIQPDSGITKKPAVIPA